MEKSNTTSVSITGSGNKVIIDSPNSTIYGDKSKPAFAVEIRNIIFQIEQISELSKEQKDYLVSLLNNVKFAVEENNEDKKAEYRSNFEKFKESAGGVAFKILDILSKCATIATVFGIGS